MSYSMYVDNITGKFFEEGWSNLTWDAIMSDDETLCRLYESAYNTDKDYEDLRYLEDKADYIRRLEALHEMSSDYFPVVSYVHVLQEEPSTDEILNVFNNAPDVVIIGDDVDNYFIGLSSAGMDFSDQLAYAYKVIDREVPKDLQKITSSYLDT